MYVSRVSFLAAAVCSLALSGCVTLEYAKSTDSYSGDGYLTDPGYHLNAPGAPSSALASTAPKLSTILSTSRTTAPAAAAAAASSSSYDAEWGVGVHAAPGFNTGSPGLTVHPMVSYTYFAFDGGHQDRFEAGGQIRKTMTGMGSRGFWLGGEAAYAHLRAHVDNVDTESTNGWSVAGLLGVPVGDAVRNMSVFGGVGYADYEGSTVIFKVGLDWQPSFMKR